MKIDMLSPLAESQSGMKQNLAGLRSDVMDLLSNVKQQMNDFFGQSNQLQQQSFSFEYQYTSISVTASQNGQALENGLNQQQSLLDKIEALLDKALALFEGEQCEKCGGKPNFNDMLMANNEENDPKNRANNISFEYSFQKLQMKYEGSLWMES